MKSKYQVINKYKGKINHNSGMTSHYKDIRIHRERKLTKLLGVGKPVATFLVKDENGILQIQEVLHNGIVVVYSFETHKKITLFAPHPSRISFLYESTGSLPSKSLLLQCEHNIKRGYNEICNI